MILNIDRTSASITLNYLQYLDNIPWLYRFIYNKAVEMGVTSGRQQLENNNFDNPIKTISIVYCLMVGAKYGILNFEQLPIKFTMDSLLKKHKNCYEMCAETLQVLVKNDFNDSIENISLDELRVYPALVNGNKLENTQTVYSKFNKQITSLIEDIFNYFSLKLPQIPQNYNPMDTNDVEKWLMKILLANNIKSETIIDYLNNLTALGNISSENLSKWAGILLFSYELLRREIVNEEYISKQEFHKMLHNFLLNPNKSIIFEQVSQEYIHKHDLQRILGEAQERRCIKNEKVVVSLVGL